MTSLLITYDFKASPEDVVQLASVQVDAIWQRGLQDEEASYQEDQVLTTEKVTDFLERNPDYEVIIAYAALPQNPEAKKPVGYILGAPYYDDPATFGIDQFYALPEVKFGKASHTLKPHKIGPTLLNEMSTNVSDCVEVIEAYPLSGSEQVYRRNGYTKDDSNPIYKKYIHN